MKKFTTILTAILIIIASVTAFAHPGRTDSSGGHTDRSTGEYHYHHGRSAHQHPNGICPYDKNGSTALETAGLVKVPERSTKPPSTPVPATPSPTEAPSESELPLFITIIGTISLVLLGGYIICGLVSGAFYLIQSLIGLFKPKPKKSYIAPMLTIPELKYGGIPERVCIDESLLPYISDRLNGYGKRYNVYITHNGHCYHRNGCSSLKNDKQLIHLYQAIDSSNFKPCGKCKPRDTKEDWYMEMFPEINSSTAMEQFIVLQRVAEKRKNATIEKIEKGLDNKGKIQFRKELAEARAKDRAETEEPNE